MWEWFLLEALLPMLLPSGYLDHALTTAGRESGT
jgi:hypothetical protein